MSDQSINPQAAFLGCVADDVTGATDLAINLVKGGMRVVQFLAVPTPAELADTDCDAIVVALKTRSIPVADAVKQSLDAVEALRQHGCQRFFFKYCSTFDSTDEGNIGPVADALIDFLDVDRTIVCPAFPQNGRTVYQGHLFVGDRLLSESGMQNHPLNPMHDSDLVRFLSKQSKYQVGLLDYDIVRTGDEPLVKRMDRLAASDVKLMVADCCGEAHLQNISDAAHSMTLITGGSGIARYLPDAWRQQRLLDSEWYRPTVPDIHGRSLILAGSCSEATQRQVQAMLGHSHAWQLDVGELMLGGSNEQSRLHQWLEQAGGDDQKPLLIYSTADTKQVAELHSKFGRQPVAAAVEEFHANVAIQLVENYQVTRIVVAGGETSGAVVNALGIRQLAIGSEICPGVPWTETTEPHSLALALKSGNFGDDFFFRTALGMLP